TLVKERFADPATNAAGAARNDSHLALKALDQTSVRISVHVCLPSIVDGQGYRPPAPMNFPYPTLRTSFSLSDSIVSRGSCLVSNAREERSPRGSEQGTVGEPSCDCRRGSTGQQAPRWLRRRRRSPHQSVPRHHRRVRRLQPSGWQDSRARRIIESRFLPVIQHEG